MISRTLACLILAAFTHSIESLPAQDQPNVLLIIGDDQGWGDFGFMGSTSIKTPHLDELSKVSVVFPMGHVPTALCRPSLMTLATGHYAHSHRVTGNDPSSQNLRRGSPLYRARRATIISNIDRFDTLPELLAEKGYLCHQSGKWWEGNYGRGGFTHGMTQGFPNPGGRHGDEGLKIGRKGLKPIRDFINTARTAKKPFMLWYAPFLPHTPHTPPERILQPHIQKGVSPHMAKYRAMCEWFDETCGSLFSILDEFGVRQDTLIIFLTDNGWTQKENSGGFAPRSKRSPYEGGTRTPILFSWPGKLKNGQRSVPVSSIDIMPTILHAVGARSPRDLPGLNLLPNICKGTSITRDRIYGEAFAHDIADPKLPEASLLYRWCIEGQWKLILPFAGTTGILPPNKRPELFNLKGDPGEKKNISRDHPQIVKRLTTKIEEWYPVSRPF